MKISAVVLTKNEESNIDRCIRSLSWCDEIIVVDDYSKDRTIEKLQTAAQKVTVYKRHLEGDFSKQRNFGLSKTSGDWVLFVDTDEIVSHGLKLEIKEKIRKGNFLAFKIKRSDYFLGKWLKYGETGSAVFIRLAKKDTGVWRGRVHEVWQVNTAVAELSNPLLHFPH